MGTVCALPMQAKITKKQVKDPANAARLIVREGFISVNTPLNSFVAGAIGHMSIHGSLPGRERAAELESLTVDPYRVRSPHHFG